MQLHGLVIGARRGVLELGANLTAVISEDQVEAAVQALSNPERFAGAERTLSALAPHLQRVLAHALEQGGWFGEAHRSQIRQAAAAAEQAEREERIDTLVAEETRMSMLVGVAVGWELARELELAPETEGD